MIKGNVRINQRAHIFERKFCWKLAEGLFVQQRKTADGIERRRDVDVDNVKIREEMLIVWEGENCQRGWPLLEERRENAIINCTSTRSPLLPRSPQVPRDCTNSTVAQDPSDYDLTIPSRSATFFNFFFIFFVLPFSSSLDSRLLVVQK